MPAVISCPRHWSTSRSSMKWIPTLVPSSFSSTTSDGSLSICAVSAVPNRLSSEVPSDPARCGVRGYLKKSPLVVPMVCTFGQSWIGCLIGSEGNGSAWDTAGRNWFAASFYALYGYTRARKKGTQFVWVPF